MRQKLIGGRERKMPILKKSLTTLRNGGMVLFQLNDLHVVEIARVALHASFQPLQQEKIFNSTHEQTPISKDAIDSVLQHREAGRSPSYSIQQNSNDLPPNTK